MEVLSHAGLTLAVGTERLKFLGLDFWTQCAVAMSIREVEIEVKGKITPLQIILGGIINVSRTDEIGTMRHLTRSAPRLSLAGLRHRNNCYYSPASDWLRATTRDPTGVASSIGWYKFLF